ncbi:MAG: peptidase M15 [Betaproteobacteria bacterium]|nr:peptidase M15 [Betaproteobacteria bacterium]MBI2959813.1 peptidase M15 [Betaproteobacteria bacterium]
MRRGDSDFSSLRLALIGRKSTSAKEQPPRRLSRHFTLRQLIFSETAARRSIDNTPPARIIGNLRILAAGLEQVRELLGHSLHISSAYRCRALNAAVGGAKTSHHLRGLAADFVCENFGTPYRACKKIAASAIEFDQLIYECGESAGERWLHLSFGPKKRRQILTICASMNFRREGLHRWPRARR